MKNKMLTISLLSISMLTGCSSASPISSQSPEVQTFQNVSIDAGFDTVLVYQETTASKDSFDVHFEEAVALFKYYNNLFDIYNNYEGMNNLKTINDNAGIAPVTVNPDILELLSEAKQFYTYSNGEFDVTMGSLLKIWHNYRTEGISLNENGELGKTPSLTELQQASTHSGWEAVEMDSTANTVYITDPNIAIDVGGIAKGFATEKIAETLEKEGVEHAAINAGGNNRTLGMKYDGSTWNVRIQNPIGSDNLLIVSRSGSESFVTSGDYERYYEAEDGNRYHHIIDPSTLFPSTRYHSVSIVTENSGVADCLSTTLFTLSYEEGMNVIQQYEENNPGQHVDAIWMCDKANAFDAPNSKIVGNLFLAWTDGLNDAITWG